MELVYYNLFSLIAGFAIALAFVWRKPRSILLLAALAVVLYVLFGIFSIPGFLLGLGTKAVIAGRQKKIKAKKR